MEKMFDFKHVGSKTDKWSSKDQEVDLAKRDTHMAKKVSPSLEREDD